MAILLGQAGPGVDTANSNAAGVAFAQKYTASASGTIDQVQIKSGATVPTAANTHWAIYDGSGSVPVNRLTADFSGTAPTANAFKAFTISPGLAVTSGTAYWIAFLSTSAGGVTWAYTNFAATGGTEIDSGAGLNALAATWTGSGANANIANVFGESLAVAAPPVFIPHRMPLGV